ncbi:unnamed protein product, partial [Mesorhabditis spiculigera]
MEIKAVHYLDKDASDRFYNMDAYVIVLIGCILVANLATFWRLKFLSLRDKGDLVARDNRLLVLLLGFSNLAFFFNGLLVALTGDDTVGQLNTIARTNVARNVAKLYARHTSAIATGILFVVYGYTCRNRNEKGPRGSIVTVTTSRTLAS